MRFASLGSGSQGNALIVESGDTRLLLDCGFSTRSTVERLARLDVAPEALNAVLVTHEHSDHMAGVFKFARRYSIPVFLTHGTHLAAPHGKTALPECRLIDSHTPFVIGDIEVQPFPVPHDAREPVQYVFFDGRFRLGVLTDAGAITQHIVDVLQDCDALVLECNHDREMLAASDYPAMLKRRISGNYGHLDNEQALSLLRRIGTARLQHLVAAHLSEHNNCPQRVARLLAAEMQRTEEWIGVASQLNRFAWRQLV